jgi:outer membrane protein TolC
MTMHIVSTEARKLPAVIVPILAALVLTATGGWAQQAPSLTLRQAVARAVERSEDVTLARLRYQAAERETAVTRSQFLPNLYAGSGAAYTSGFPLAAGGGAPAVVSLTYNQTIFDPLARGEVRAAEQREEQMRLAMDGARDAVISRVASNYLELAKLRRSQELLTSERASASRILAFTRQRAEAGLELPIEVTRAQLTAARIEQSIARLENNADALAEQLRVDLGLAPDQPLEVAAEDLPAVAEPDAAGAERAVENSIDLRQVASERETMRTRLQAENRSRWPTFSINGQYNVLSQFNNYDVFFNKFQRHNVVAGVQIRIPLFSARTSAGVAAAQANFVASQAAFNAKRTEVSRELLQTEHRLEESTAAREVARLELELAQQNTGVVQARFNEGRASLRELEAAQLDQNDKWLAFLDADFARQQAQLALMQATGQVSQLAQ